MLYQGNHYFINVKLNFCYRQSCIHDEENIQPVTNTHNKFTKCQTSRNKL